MKTIFGIVLGCFIVTLSAYSQPDGRTCEANQQRLASVIEHAKSKTPAAQFGDLLRFLDSVPDDPADCVSSAAIDRIRTAERRLIVLHLGKQTLQPDWVFHCNQIDGRSAWCSGGELDTSALLPEGAFGARQTRSAVVLAKTAELQIDDAYPCHLTGVYGSSTTALQAGKPAVSLASHHMTIELAGLPRKSPVLIVALSCPDQLHERKVVWHLY